MMKLSEQRWATSNLALAFTVMGLRSSSAWELWLGLALAACWGARFVSLMWEPLAPETKGETSRSAWNTRRNRL
jgi:hypothetical protein